MATRLRPDGWRLESAAVAEQDGGSISQPGLDVGGWHETAVPSTVLCALVKAGVYPDPRFGLDVFRIPDSSDEFNAAHDLARFSHLPDRRNPWRDPWWYRTEFDLEPVGPGQRVWLNLHCLNYRADVWVNGAQVADREQTAGMFQRFRLDVTDQVRAGRNALAILVYPVDHPGVPDTQLEVYGPVRNFLKENRRDVTEMMTLGYDCFPTVPDRNMGLIQEVTLDVTGAVDLRHLFVKADLPRLDRAELTVSTELANTSSSAVSGTLHGVVRDPAGTVIATFARPVELGARATVLVVCDASRHGELVLRDPQLWWPRGHGGQPLYRLSVRFETEGGVSAAADTAFGVRRVERELHELDGAHGFRLLVNGRRIFLRGGYVQPEMMFDWDAARVETELRYLTEANLNYLVFEDIPNPPDYLLDLCDRLGLLFWNCFYGCYWMQPSTEYPDDLALLEACTIDLVKRYRSHPSLVIYMAQNEGETRQPVYELWRRHVLELDGTRPLVPSGSYPDYRTDVPEWTRPELPVGMNDYSPRSYSWETPATYYRWVRTARNWMFMIESGSASVPALESLLEFLPGLRDLPPNPGDNPLYPLDSAWAHYGANSYYEWFDRALRRLHGEPVDVRDYVWKAHLVAYDQHRALFEAVHHRLWDVTSGFGEWKLNAAFPDVQWQLYDWFLRPTVSLFAVRKACAPLAVQLCPLDGMVTVINNHPEDRAGLEVEAAVYDLQLRLLHRQSATVCSAADSYRDVFVLPQPTSADDVPVYFVKLALRGPDGALLADNFYWLSPRLQDCEPVYTGDPHQYSNEPMELPRANPCFPELHHLPPVTLEVAAEPAPGEAALCVRVTNPTDHLAFFIRLRLLEAEGGAEVLPVFWEDNYFSLLPGESKEVRACLAQRYADTGVPVVQVDGWNITERTYP